MVAAIDLAYVAAGRFEGLGIGIKPGTSLPGSSGGRIGGIVTDLDLVVAITLLPIWLIASNPSPIPHPSRFDYQAQASPIIGKDKGGSSYYSPRLCILCVIFLMSKGGCFVFQISGSRKGIKSLFVYLKGLPYGAQGTLGKLPENHPIRVVQPRCTGLNKSSGGNMSDVLRVEAKGWIKIQDITGQCGTLTSQSEISACSTYTVRQDHHYSMISTCFDHKAMPSSWGIGQEGPDGGEKNPSRCAPRRSLCMRI